LADETALAFPLELAQTIS